MRLPVSIETSWAAAVVVLVLCLSGAGQAFAQASAKDGPDAEIVSVKKIWDQGAHNAFTDLIRFKGKWFCSFREGDGHVGGDGHPRVLVSEDGETWKSAALLTEKGIDLRDPKFCITSDGRLMMVMGGSTYKAGNKLVDRQPRVAFSEDGYTWTEPRQAEYEGEWLWRVTWHNGWAYGVDYSGPVSGGKDWTLTLLRSKDGIRFEKVTALAVPGRPNETTLRFTKDGRMVAFVRREGGNRMAWIGQSAAPYTEWKWHETSYAVGGPNFIILPDGAMWGGGRFYPGGAKTVLGRFGVETYEPVLTLPSGGDTSYPGFVWHDGLLWMSYYSSHEGKTSIYLAKIRLRKE